VRSGSNARILFITCFPRDNVNGSEKSGLFWHTLELMSSILASTLPLFSLLNSFVNDVELLLLMTSCFSGWSKKLATTELSLNQSIRFDLSSNLRAKDALDYFKLVFNVLCVAYNWRRHHLMCLKLRYG